MLLMTSSTIQKTTLKAKKIAILKDNKSDYSLGLSQFFTETFTKLGGTIVAARVTGLGWRDSAALGSLMNTRGLMELIVLNIGLDLGVISEKLFAIPGTTDQFITSAQLQPPEGDLEKSETFERFASIDFAHPVLSVFENREARYLTKVAVYRRFPLKLPALMRSSRMSRSATPG